MPDKQQLHRENHPEWTSRAKEPSDGRSSTIALQYPSRCLQNPPRGRLRNRRIFETSQNYVVLPWPTPEVPFLHNNLSQKTPFTDNMSHVNAVGILSMCVDNLVVWYFGVLLWETPIYPKLINSSTSGNYSALVSPRLSQENKSAYNNRPNCTTFPFASRPTWYLFLDLIDSFFLFHSSVSSSVTTIKGSDPN